MTPTNREERDDMVTLHSPVTAEQLAHRPWREVIGPIHPDDPELATITREDR